MRYIRKYTKPERATRWGAAADFAGGYTQSLPAVGVQSYSRQQKRPVVQRYSIADNGDKISDHEEFAVRNEGKPESELFVRPDIVPFTLNTNIVRFNIQDGGDNAPLGMRKVHADIAMSSEEVAKAHCGDFSEALTGRREEVENGTAGPGRSMYMQEMEWSTQITNEGVKSRGNWDNHFAAVILADGGDRASFETAVTVDHAWFGIYGQSREQSFRFKTVMADIELAFARGNIDEPTYLSLKHDLTEYAQTGMVQSKDSEMKEELKRINVIIGKTPDLDGPRKEKEKANEEARQIREVYQPMFKKESAIDICNQLQLVDDDGFRRYIISSIERWVYQTKDEIVKDKLTEVRNVLNM